MEEEHAIASRIPNVPDLTSEHRSVSISQRSNSYNELLLQERIVGNENVEKKGHCSFSGIHSLNDFGAAQEKSNTLLSDELLVHDSSITQFKLPQDNVEKAYVLFKSNINISHDILNESFHHLSSEESLFQNDKNSELLSTDPLEIDPFVQNNLPRDIFLQASNKNFNVYNENSPIYTTETSNISKCLFDVGFRKPQASLAISTHTDNKEISKSNRLLFNALCNMRLNDEHRKNHQKNSSCSLKFCSLNSECLHETVFVVRSKAKEDNANKLGFQRLFPNVEKSKFQISNKKFQASFKDIGVQKNVKVGRVAAPLCDDTITFEAQTMEVEINDSDDNGDSDPDEPSSHPPEANSNTADGNTAVSVDENEAVANQDVTSVVSITLENDVSPDDQVLERASEKENGNNGFHFVDSDKKESSDNVEYAAGNLPSPIQLGKRNELTIDESSTSEKNFTTENQDLNNFPEVCETSFEDEGFVEKLVDSNEKQEDHHPADDESNDETSDQIGKGQDNSEIPLGKEIRTNGNLSGDTSKDISDKLSANAIFLKGTNIESYVKVFKNNCELSSDLGMNADLLGRNGEQKNKEQGELEAMQNEDDSAEKNNETEGNVSPNERSSKEEENTGTFKKKEAVKEQKQAEQEVELFEEIKRNDEISEMVEEKGSKTDEITQEKISETAEVVEGKGSKTDEITEEKISETAEVVEGKGSKTDEITEEKISETAEVVEEKERKTEEIVKEKEADVKDGGKKVVKKIEEMDDMCRNMQEKQSVDAKREKEDARDELGKNKCVHEKEEKKETVEKLEHKEAAEEANEECDSINEMENGEVHTEQKYEEERNVVNADEDAVEKQNGKLTKENEEEERFETHKEIVTEKGKPTFEDQNEKNVEKEENETEEEQEQISEVQKYETAQDAAEDSKGQITREPVKELIKEQPEELYRKETTEVTEEEQKESSAGNGNEVEGIELCKAQIELDNREVEIIGQQSTGTVKKQQQQIPIEHEEIQIEKHEAQFVNEKEQILKIQNNKVDGEKKEVDAELKRVDMEQKEETVEKEEKEIVVKHEPIVEEQKRERTESQMIREEHDNGAAKEYLSETVIMQAKDIGEDLKYEANKQKEEEITNGDETVSGKHDKAEEKKERNDKMKEGEEEIAKHQKEITEGQEDKNKEVDEKKIKRTEEYEESEESIKKYHEDGTNEEQENEIFEEGKEAVEKMEVEMLEEDAVERQVEITEQEVYGKEREGKEAKIEEIEQVEQEQEAEIEEVEQEQKEEIEEVEQEEEIDDEKGEVQEEEIEQEKETGEEKKVETEGESENQHKQEEETEDDKEEEPESEKEQENEKEEKYEAEEIEEVEELKTGKEIVEEQGEVTAEEQEIAVLEKSNVLTDELKMETAKKNEAPEGTKPMTDGNRERERPTQKDKIQTEATDSKPEEGEDITQSNNNTEATSENSILQLKKLHETKEGVEPDTLIDDKFSTEKVQNKEQNHIVFHDMKASSLKKVTKATESTSSVKKRLDIEVDEVETAVGSVRPEEITDDSEEVIEDIVEAKAMSDAESSLKIADDTDLSEKTEHIIRMGSKTSEESQADNAQNDENRATLKENDSINVSSNKIADEPESTIIVDKNASVDIHTESDENVLESTEQTTHEMVTPGADGIHEAKLLEDQKLPGATPRRKRKRKTASRARSVSKKDGSSSASGRGSSSKKSPASATGGAVTKKVLPTKNGQTSTSRASSAESKKIPPIKAPVGNAPPPKVKNVKSKIGSLQNIKHKPKGGDKKVETVKLEWNTASKIGSLENATHKPGGGDKKIITQKLDFKDKVQSKVGSKDNIKHKPGGGTVKVETQKLEFKEKATSKVGSMDNVKHKAGGGNVKILSEKMNFKERAASKVNSLSGSEKGSTHGSETQSPVPPTSPTPVDAMPPVSENGEAEGSVPNDSGVVEENGKDDLSPEKPNLSAELSEEEHAEDKSPESS